MIGLAILFIGGIAGVLWGWRARTARSHQAVLPESWRMDYEYRAGQRGEDP